jgi:hypothetical protein
MELNKESFPEVKQETEWDKKWIRRIIRHELRNYELKLQTEDESVNRLILIMNKIGGK